jgi:hypothetical protein
MEMGLLANYKQNLPESGGFEGLEYVFLERGPTALVFIFSIWVFL